MGLFERLFHKKKVEKGQEEAVDFSEKKAPLWKNVSGYLPADQNEYQLISLITTAIAAGDQPESSFVLKHVSKRNPEVKLVAAIISSIVAVNQPESQFVIRSIKEKNI